MPFAQQPADVSEEESTTGVVWIAICFAEFVVKSMITTPCVNIELIEFRF